MAQLEIKNKLEQAEAETELISFEILSESLVSEQEKPQETTYNHEVNNITNNIIRIIFVSKEIIVRVVLH